jgi:hypothetical protein
MVDDLSDSLQEFDYLIQLGLSHSNNCFSFRYISILIFVKAASNQFHHMSF